ncbi:iduronate 2-sulfatase isoform X4 [Monomorium pharaonis]|uniref:iduronate 2-sulfatase isoform X4 n=1 Tax=Monomorium pharaonis TaxID=307658 RepID=UPI00063EE237|nr:iduronate 2-sulfatase isoform X4 [Monomorium pharaonis]
MFFFIRFNFIAIMLICVNVIVAARPNILLIIVDDLRTTLGCYGDANAYTPNIDALAEDGIVFTEAFAQQALCAPSRNSFLTGRRPDTLRLYDFYSYWRDTVGNYTTLPEHLKNNGYTTMSIGKVFHPEYHPIRKFKLPESYLWPDNVNDVAYNPWTDLRWRQDVAKLKLKFPWEKIPEKFAKRIIQSYYAAVSYIDSLIGKLMHQLHVSRIRENTVVILTSDHGWALGEHVVWSKYSNFDVAVHVPLIMSIPMITFDNYHDNYSAISTDYMRYAPITNNNKMENKINSKYVLNVGKIDVSNTSTEYIKSTFGKYIQRDHDISMDINTLHSKKYCRTTNAIVELVDIFPTIADLAGVPILICQINNTDNRSHPTGLLREKTLNLCGEGITLLPLIKSILKCQSVSWKKAAFSQYPRPGIQPTLHPNSDKPRLKEINVMGYTLKTSNYRYTAWLPFAHTTCKPDWDVIIAEELYDHRIDRAENFNVAASPRMLKIKKYLRALLRDGWRHALPRYKS